MVSHRESAVSPGSPHRVETIQHAGTYNTRQWKHKQINLTYTKKSM